MTNFTGEENEIEKMYENAGIEKCNSSLKDIMPNVCLKNNEDENYKCEDCEYNWYPEFTAEKQIEITKFLLKKAVYYDVKDDKYWFYYEECESASYKPFEEAIAHFINKLWQDLTDAEKAEIKNLLEM